ncbi:DUF4142 domain-containing protein [Mariniflexile sp. HNIBRBA6329]|uniref:DUF4142 domain-containing protein n=1 Tax=Mariniflexile sp. HNIBRBA6329 TaxID=3373088 RepID=UPI0037456F0D
MTINKNIIKHLVLTLIITVGVSFISCDFDREENDNNLFNSEIVNDRVKTNIEEAKVLSDIVVLNKTIIGLSQLSAERSTIYSVKTISNKLIKDNTEINKSLNDLAYKKLILLPNSLDKKEIKELNEIDKTDFSKAYLSKVKELLESEIMQLEYLSNITSDIDFKVLAAKILVKLDYNLNQINKIIKKN